MADAKVLTRRAFMTLGGMALAGCGQSSKPEEPKEPEEPEKLEEPKKSEANLAEAEVTASSAHKALVVFYSRAGENYPGEWLEVGHTKVMAGYIAEALGADLYEIVPVEPYPEGYDDCCDVALAEQRDDVRPAITGDLPDTTPYDLVFIGCPIWWGDEPMIVRTFVEGVDLAGKTIVPFTTHGGSGLGRVPSNLQGLLQDNRFLDGLAVAGTEVDGAHDEVVSWAKNYALA